MKWGSGLNATWNDEVDAVVPGPEVGAVLETSMARVMARAKPVSLEQWRKRGTCQRLHEALTWPVLDLL